MQYILCTHRNNVNCSHDVLIYMDKTCGKKRWIIFPSCKTLLRPLWEGEATALWRHKVIFRKYIFRNMMWNILIKKHYWNLKKKSIRNERGINVIRQKFTLLLFLLKKILSVISGPSSKLRMFSSVLILISNDLK